ncbi:MAG: hypothetical protein ACKO5E_01730 [bacterium]
MTPRHPAQFSVSLMLVLVALFALNFWLFRQGIFWGIIGLNVSKHVIIAWLCRNLGVNRAIDPAVGDPLADAE